MLGELLRFARPADQTLSIHFRRHREIGQQDRAFIAESVFAVLRRKRSLEAAAGSAEPRALLVAALVRVFGLSGRALGADAELVSILKSFSGETLSDAERADLPDWLWQRLAQERGPEEAMAIAQGLLAQAPLDLRVNLAKMPRDEALARRVLMPADYLTGVPAERIAQGIGPGADAALRMYFDTSGIKAIGYRMYLFFP